MTSVSDRQINADLLRPLLHTSWKFYLVVAIPWEERSLERSFGDEYERYKARVRWRMIPFIY